MTDNEDDKHWMQPGLAGWLATGRLFKNGGAAIKSRVVSTTNSNTMCSVKTAHFGGRAPCSARQTHMGGYGARNLKKTSRPNFK